MKPPGNLEVHHSVEKYIQERLEIPAQFRDECPGIPMTRKAGMGNAGPYHGGTTEEGGLAATLRSNGNIPTNIPFQTTADKQVIVDRLKAVYSGDLQDLWPVSRDWLRKMKAQGHLDNGINIPD